jgi:hypothetical protein
VTERVVAGWRRALARRAEGRPGQEKGHDFPASGRGERGTTLVVPEKRAIILSLAALAAGGADVETHTSGG